MRIPYDFHLHSCLSPCGDADMTPNNIVNMAVLLGYSAIALTDHNTCGNCAATAAVAAEAGLLFLPGMELCTAEEAHVVCLFPTVEAASAFDATVAPTRPPVKNRPDIFGEQIFCNAEDEPVGTEPILLTTASSISVDAVLALARQYGGTAFPAHIDRPSYSVPAALGDLPPLGFTAVEITADGDVSALRRQFTAMGDCPALLDSDAHYLHQMADPTAWVELEDSPSPEALIAAIDGRRPAAWHRPISKTING